MLPHCGPQACTRAIPASYREEPHCKGNSSSGVVCQGRVELPYENPALLRVVGSWLGSQREVGFSQTISVPRTACRAVSGTVRRGRATLCRWPFV